VTKPARFTAADVRRALRAAETLGIGIAGYEIKPDGTIKVIVGSPESGDNINWFAGSPLYRDVA
jgi:hypothetical protein